MESEVVSWAVVSFPNGGTATVRASWLNEDNKVLMWPPKITNYLKALKENMQPNHNWIPYDNVRLLLTCDSYNKAKRFEDKYVRTGCPTTELESEEVVLERTKRRARPNPMYIDSEEESETSSAKRRFAKPPEINFPGTTTLSQYSRTPNLNTSGISMIDNQGCQYTDERLWEKRGKLSFHKSVHAHHGTEGIQVPQPLSQPGRVEQILDTHFLWMCDMSQFGIQINIPPLFSSRFCMQKSAKLVPGVTLDLIEKIPGRLNDRRTPLGELNWIFTAITDTIAWNVLPRDLFQKLFRQDLLVASLFRNFLLAERIMRSYNCTPVSSPRLPPTYMHAMW
ncbi:hypothetical protein AMECASPLE_002731 [Ameca splendens]|uniref:Uncharacterized protein n=1 Tax=Ameca splendens TaxID=208324 RepID=A0ABV0ZJB1_9TELE